MTATTASSRAEDCPTSTRVDRAAARPRSPLSSASAADAIFIAILLFIVIYPMVWMFLGSFKTQDEFLNAPFWALPENWSLDNYVEVFTTGNFGSTSRNSILVVFPSLASSSSSASPPASRSR